MMARRDTKAAIVEVALRLFAERGYEGVGVRDIAEAVGIQPASLYKHYAGKQAIFDAVVERMNAAYDDFVLKLQMPDGMVPAGATSQLAEGYATLPPGAIEAMSVAMFRYWTEDEHAVSFRHLLVMEQYRNPAIGRLYRSYFMEKPLEHQAKLFAEMMRVGYFKQSDARLMAIEFFSPILLLMVAADGCEGAAERDEIADCVRAYVERFGRMHAREG
ncbi:MAG: helix-turn-helix domain-containing protein [Gordonibacter sp.]|uniref:TetR/AcrR family transcriptional regulator n=1 Tax=Gordonibacter sp. TaxID=1968902 RepID=UPI002FC6131F